MCYSVNGRPSPKSSATVEHMKDNIVSTLFFLVEIFTVSWCNLVHLRPLTVTVEIVRNAVLSPFSECIRHAVHHCTAERRSNRIIEEKKITQITSEITDTYEYIILIFLWGANKVDYIFTDYMIRNIIRFAVNRDSTLSRQSLANYVPSGHLG